MWMIISEINITGQLAQNEPQLKFSKNPCLCVVQIQCQCMSCSLPFLHSNPKRILLKLRGRTYLQSLHEGKMQLRFFFLNFES